MPELAEVAYACSLWNKGLKKSIKQVELKERARVFRDTDVRKFVEFLEGTTLLKSATHGKQMLFSFSNKIWIGIHLGMTGSLSIQEANYESKKHDVLIIRQTKQVLVFTDPRQFGRIRIHQGSQEPPWWSELPIGMLDDSFQVDFLINTILRHPRKPIKALLLDQRYFLGMGNWMADEVLWRSKLYPGQRSGKLSEQQIRILFEKILFVVNGAMGSVGKHGGDPPKGWLFHVRWKDGGICPKTGTILKREKIGGRTTCWSPSLQV